MSLWGKALGSPREALGKPLAPGGFREPPKSPGARGRGPGARGRGGEFGVGVPEALVPRDLVSGPLGRAGAWAQFPIRGRRGLGVSGIGPGRPMSRDLQIGGDFG